MIRKLGTLLVIVGLLAGFLACFRSIVPLAG